MASVFNYHLDRTLEKELLTIAENSKIQGANKVVVEDGVLLPNWFRKKWDSGDIATYTSALKTKGLLNGEISWLAGNDLRHVHIWGITVAGKLRLAELRKSFVANVWDSIWGDRVGLTAKAILVLLGAAGLWLIDLLFGWPL